MQNMVKTPHLDLKQGTPLDFGPTGRVGEPHLSPRKNLPKQICERDGKLEEGGARVRASGKPCSAFEEKEKTKSWVNVKILQISTIVRQNFYQEEHHFDAKKQSEIF